jgi:hypothetical protein
MLPYAPSPLLLQDSGLSQAELIKAVNAVHEMHLQAASRVSFFFNIC